MSYHILIIEDDKAMIKSLKLTIRERLGPVRLSSSGFSNAKDKVASLRPDAVVMDMFEDTLQSTVKAEATWDYIWDVHFCPVVVHSAREEPDFLKGKHHPFAHYEPKGKDSQERVANRLKLFCAHIDCLRVFGDEVTQRASESLRHVSALIWKETTNDNERKDILVRVTRRRLAASLDSPAHGAKALKALEQFIYPPLEASLLTGDILQVIAANQKQAKSYRVVLTPSCDLVVADDRFPVEDVLVACCIPVTDAEIVRRCNLREAKPKDLPQKLGRKLREDSRIDMVVLPALQGVWPAMVLDLKRLEIIQRSKIALNSPRNVDALHVRVASMDSPFRERLAWRYITTCGRPGLPEMDQEALEKDVTAAADERKE